MPSVSKAIALREFLICLSYRILRPQWRPDSMFVPPVAEIYSIFSVKYASLSEWHAFRGVTLYDSFSKTTIERRSLPLSIDNTKCRVFLHSSIFSPYILPLTSTTHTKSTPNLLFSRNSCSKSDAIIEMVHGISWG